MTSLPLVQLPAQRVWIWADLHLQEARPAEIAAFAESLHACPQDLGCVLILGDLFDAWVGPEMWALTAFTPLTEALRGLAERDIRLILIRGNRDVLMEPADARLVGAELADQVLWMGERSVLISHGDEYCLKDLPYQSLRRNLRRPWLRKVLRMLPLGARYKIAAKMRGRSSEAIARKPLDSMALDEAAIGRVLAQKGAKKALIGHLHQAETRQLDPDHQLEILAAWSPGQSPFELA